MKTGKSLVRILAVLLLVAMMVGFVPAAPVTLSDADPAPSPAAASETAENDAGTPQSGGTDEKQTPGEQGQGTEPSAQTDTPKKDDDKKQEENPEAKEIKVTFDENVVTVKNGEAELKYEGEKAPTIKPDSETPVELTISLKDEHKDASVFVNNGMISDGKYTVKNTDTAVNIVAVTASVSGKADEWSQSKTVTVKLYGTDVNGNKVYLVSEDAKSEAKEATVKGNEATFTIGGKNTGVEFEKADYTVKLDKNDPAGEKVTVYSVDNVKPRLENQEPEIKKYSTKASFKVNVTDISRITAKVSYEQEKIQRIWDEPRTETKYVNDRYVHVDNNVITFDAQAKYNGNPIQYIVLVTDKAGNVNSITVSVPKENDTESPVIDRVVITSGSQVFDSNKITNFDEPIWIGNDSTIEVTAHDDVFTDYKGNFNGTIGIKSENSDPILANNPDKIEKVESGYKDYYELSGQRFKGTLSGKGVAEGKYKAYAKDHAGTETTDIPFTVNVDTTAPTIAGAKFVDGTVFESIVRIVTGGVMYHDKVNVQLDKVEDPAGENESASGIYEYHYEFTLTSSEATKTAGTILAKDVENYKLEITAPADNGTYTLKVWAEDNAGNNSAPVEVKGGTVGVEGKPDSATNKATEKGQSKFAKSEDKTEVETKVAVFAYTNDMPYTGDKWAKSVTFDVTAKITVFGSTSKTDDANATNGEVYYDIDPKLIVTTSKDGSGSVKISDPDLKLDGSNDYEKKNFATYKWTVTVGTGKDMYEGGLNFSVNIGKKWTANVTEETDANENTTSRVVTWSETGINADNIVTDYVKIQNYIASATVTENGEKTENGWYNGLNKQLTALNVANGTNKAPFKTTYTLKYAENPGVNEEKEVGSWTLNTSTWQQEDVKESNDGDVLGLIKDYDKNHDKGGIYTLTVKTELNPDEFVGNVPTENEQTYTIKYDVNAANIKAAFTEESTKDASYYDIQRTGTVTVQDDTFTGGENIKLITGTRTDSTNEEVDTAPGVITVAVTQAYGSDARITKQEYNFKEKQWVIEYTYGVTKQEAEKLDGDAYKLKVNVTDNAGNVSSTDESGIITLNNIKKVEDGSVYSGDSADLFTIDQTKPVVTVTFDNNNARNGKYFNSTRVATITVVEHNFAPDDNHITLTTNGASGNSGWKKDENRTDTYVMTVTFANDANCSFAISVTDKAGNVCTDGEVNYGNTVAKDDFVIDKTAPQVSYTGTNASPYAGACTPGFTATDTNLGNENTYRLTRNTMKGNNQDVTNLLAHSGSSASFSYANIPTAQDNDGIYTFSCSVTDLAGNTTTLNPVEFAVNRHGSVYTMSDELGKINGTNLNKDAWASVDKANLIIHEFNPTQLKDGTKLQVYRGSELVKSYTGAELNSLVKGGGRGSVGLYQYDYTIPASIMDKDGSYRVVITSTDSNDHLSANDLKNAKVEFVIDTVAPEITSITGLEKRTVNAKEQDLGFSIRDTYGLKSVKIYTDGKGSTPTKEYVSQAYYDQLKKDGKLAAYQEVLPENGLELNDAIKLMQRSTPYRVVIEVTDNAGNTTVANDGKLVYSTSKDSVTPPYEFLASVTVSTNPFVRFFHNPPAMIGTGVGIAVIAAVIWLLLAKKKSKDEQAA